MTDVSERMTRNTTELMGDDDLETAFMRQETSAITTTATGFKSSEQLSLLSFNSSKRSSLDYKNKEEIRRIEKERKEHVEVCLIWCKIRKFYDEIF